MPAGAPRKYKDRKAIFLEIEKLLAVGDRCLEAILESSDNFPHPTDFYEWARQDTEEGRELSYILTRMQESWCRQQMRKTIEIADDSSNDILETEVTYVNKQGEVKTIKNRTSDNTPVNRAKLRIQARQWAMAKLAPKIFGEKMTQEITGKDGAPIVPVIELITKEIK